jgi:signal transduction histidine kinase
MAGAIVPVMAPVTAPPNVPPAPGRRALASLNAGSLGVAIGFAVTAAAVLNPIFVTPFAVLLGRTLFLSMFLLLVFVACQRVPEQRQPGWLPRWLLTVLAVALAAPLGTLLIYAVAVGGRLGDFVGSEPRLTGFAITSITALVLGLLITLTAQLREREARARNQALEFELERSRLEKLALDARLDLLQAQIEPHVLFNTLANVQALVESGSPNAARVLQSLVAYLRAAMPRLHEREPTLGDELQLVRAYLELMQMRMPDRLRFDIDVPAALHGQRFMAMALLTLVENAVRHGIDPCEQGGRIDIGARADVRGLHLWVSDDGVGMAEDAPAGTGLANLRDRLAHFHRPAARLELRENQPRGLHAEIVIPTAG